MPELGSNRNEQDKQEEHYPIGGITRYIEQIALRADPHAATFDQLAEEVMELHLSYRGKHEHTPAMEWLEIATIATNALCVLPADQVDAAFAAWLKKHGNIR